MDEDKVNGIKSEEAESLETPSTETNNGAAETDNSPEAADSKSLDGTTITTTEKKEKKPWIKRGIEKLSSINIYLLGFILLLAVAGMIVLVAYLQDKREESKEESLVTEPLSQEALDQLRQSDVQVGDPKQILSIESNAIFAGKVLIRDSLEVAGQLKIGGPLELSGISASGTSTFDKIQGQSLDIAGNSSVQGQLSVGQSLTVGGNLSVSGALTAGQLTIQNLEVSNDLRLSGHIDTGGGTPSRSNGNALGGGGTTSVSGTDTAGTVNINTGGGPGSGCFVTLTFTRPFGDTPHVTVTPVGGAAASVRYYVNRSSSGFSICTANNPPAGQSFAFDYIVID